MGLVGSVASKYMIDIITGYQMSKLWIMIVITLGSAFFSMTIGNVIGRISTKLSIYINNDIQADIFDKIIDADWMEISKYSNGDILNRFNGDIHTVSSNAISWLPTIIIALYKLAATFMVILHYDWVMALIALGSAPFLLLLSRNLPEFPYSRMGGNNQAIRNHSIILLPDDGWTGSIHCQRI